MCKGPEVRVSGQTRVGFSTSVVIPSLSLSLFLSLGLVTGKRYSGCSRAGAVPTLGRVYVRGAPSMTVEVERDRDE